MRPPVEAARPRHRLVILAAALIAGMMACGGGGQQAASDKAAGGPQTILNVSYDPTRELYASVDSVFAKRWEDSTHTTVTVQQSHGGSGTQARAVMDGLEADVVTLALAYDIDAIAKAGLVASDWQTKMPQHSTPFTSTIVFLVRKGNPKGIHDWADLVKPGVQVITPNPKTSGGARWNYLAAWGYALQHFKGDSAAAEGWVKQLYHNVPILDSGARGATTTFTERGIGDVLIAWESEALLAKQKLGPEKVEVVIPSVSILAETPVALVDKVVDKHGTRAVAEAYLKFLYSDEGQEIAARNYLRPQSPAIAAKYASQFPAVKLFTIDSVFHGWQHAQDVHFADGGAFDRIYAPGK